MEEPKRHTASHKTCKWSLTGDTTCPSLNTERSAAGYTCWSNTIGPASLRWRNWVSVQAPPSTETQLWFSSISKERKLLWTSQTQDEGVDPSSPLALYRHITDPIFSPFLLTVFKICSVCELWDSCLKVTWRQLLHQGHFSSDNSDDMSLGYGAW